MEEQGKEVKVIKLQTSPENKKLTEEESKRLTDLVIKNTKSF